MIRPNRLAPFLLAALLPAPGFGDEPPAIDHKVDVIYGRKFGTALTMDVFTPKQANGAAVVFLVSGGFFSSHEAINPKALGPFLDRGYTVFAVVHGSQPKFTLTEIVSDVNRAVRFIRHHAQDYAIDPGRIGVTGASAGGHLSLMLGTAGEAGDPQAKDPVDRESSRVRAVACFFPPTDFLHFGDPGRELFRPTDHQRPYRPAFDYRELDPSSNLWVAVTDEAKLREITREVSPHLARHARRSARPDPPRRCRYSCPRSSSPGRSSRSSKPPAWSPSWSSSRARATAGPGWTATSASSPTGSTSI